KSDRGAKYSYYWVTLQQDFPSVLVEMGFITNERECMIMANADNQSKIADAIANGVYAYFARSGLTYSGSGSDTATVPEGPVIPVEPNVPDTPDIPDIPVTPETDEPVIPVTPETSEPEETRESSGAAETTDSESGETIFTGIPEIDEILNDPDLSGGIRVE
ncbi:MAG: N-acetylmuramoyl-L-alanine amidase, partial [Oscillospiraceae bacterium]|nr:N-acetylmuramoyl-L-alanine amidase [Oscillospiraceae bacterium]